MNLEVTVTWLEVIFLFVYNAPPKKKKTRKKKKRLLLFNFQSMLEECQSEFCDIKATHTKRK